MLYGFSIGCCEHVKYVDLTPTPNLAVLSQTITSLNIHTQLCLSRTCFFWTNYLPLLSSGIISETQRSFSSRPTRSSLRKLQLFSDNYNHGPLRFQPSWDTMHRPGDQNQLLHLEVLEYPLDDPVTALSVLEGSVKLSVIWQVKWWSRAYINGNATIKLCLSHIRTPIPVHWIWPAPPMNCPYPISACSWSTPQVPPCLRGGCWTQAVRKEWEFVWAWITGDYGQVEATMWLISKNYKRVKQKTF